MLDVKIQFPYAAAISSGGATSRIATLGNNPDIDVGTEPEDVWAGAELGILNGIDHRFIPKPQTPVSMEIVSDSANDTLLGTGARTVTVGYLDSGYKAKSVTLNMAGLTPVALPEPVIRVNSVIVATSGTFGDNNAGNISVRLVGGLGATYSYMQIGIGIAKTSLFTVPDLLQFDVLSIVLSINRTDTVDRWATFSLCNQNAAGRLIKGIEISCSTTVPYRHESADIPIITYPARTDAWIRCEAVSANNSNVTAGIFGIQRNPLAYGF